MRARYSAMLFVALPIYSARQISVSPRSSWIVYAMPAGPGLTFTGAVGVYRVDGRFSNGTPLYESGGMTRQALTTDLYQLSMAAAYIAGGVEQRASFELFVRRMPQNRGYLIAAGLEQALEYLSALRFDADDLDFLRSLPMFQDAPADFFKKLERLRFTGNVSAAPEGTVIFANEPLLRVEAPIIEAQLAETYLLSTMLFQTMIASKAARVVDAASGRPVVDFGNAPRPWT